MVRQRVRIRFSKLGNLRFIGHKDLLRAFESLFRRAKLPLAMSKGFHPKIKMSLPSALALGVQSQDEILELEFDENADVINVGRLLEEMNRTTIKGLTFLSATHLAEGEKKAKLVSSVFEMTIPTDKRQETAAKIPGILAAESVEVAKANGKSVNLKASLTQLSFDEERGLLKAVFASQDGPEGGVRELMIALELEKEYLSEILPIRTECRI